MNQLTGVQSNPSLQTKALSTVDESPRSNPTLTCGETPYQRPPDATRKGRRKGRRALALVSEAAESAAEAAIGVVTDAARAMMPDEGKPRKRKAAADAASTRH